MSLIVAALLSLEGCVSLQWQDGRGNIQHVGMLRYSVVETDTARIFVRENVGLDLRFTAEDPGMTVGYRKSVSVQPRQDPARNRSSSGYFWAADSVSKQAGLFMRKSWGAELGFSHIAFGLSLGFDKAAIVLGPTRGESVTGQIDFDEENLAATRFVYRKEPP